MLKERGFSVNAEKERLLTVSDVRNYACVPLVTKCDMEFGSALCSFSCIFSSVCFLFFCYIFGFWIDARAAEHTNWLINAGKEQPMNSGKYA